MDLFFAKRNGFGYRLFFLFFFFVFVFLTACGNGAGSQKPGGDSSKLSVVATIFPEYDWVKNIVGDVENVEITQLLDNGTDLHSFQPTAEDIAKVANCDVFIYVGGESDEWVEDALKESVNKDMVVINLLEELGDAVKEEEVIEGMEAEEEEGEGEEEPEYDEHVWLSLRNTEILCEKIEEGMAKADSEHADIYKMNAEEYVGALKDLDQKYEEIVSAAKVKTLLFGDRFPFRYLTEDYGLDYYAAFVGCSAETEASFETISFLAKKADELGLTHIMKIESSDGKLADTIISNTKSKDQKVLTLDSMQATTSKDVKNGTTYFKVMEDNLKVLEEALS